MSGECECNYSSPAKGYKLIKLPGLLCAEVIIYVTMKDVDFVLFRKSPVL